MLVVGNGLQADEVKLLRLVQHVLAGMNPTDRQEKAMTEMVEIADVGKRAVRSRRTGNPITHLERCAIRKRHDRHITQT